MSLFLTVSAVSSTSARHWWSTKDIAPRVLLPAMLLLALACKSDSFRPESKSNDPDLYWDLVLNHHGVILSTTPPYDTLQLVATPRNYLGQPLPGLPAPQFRSANMERVLVTADGKLVAASPTPPNQPIWVYVTLTTNNLKHADSVLVSVVDNPAPPVLDSFSIHPTPPDSAKYAIGIALMFKNLPVHAFDTAGNPIAGLPVVFRSSNPLQANVDRDGTVIPLRLGTVKIDASITAYGVTKADTVLFRIGRPVIAFVDIGWPKVRFPWGTILSPDIEIAAGGSVAFGYGYQANVTALFETHDIFFEEVAITFKDADLPNIVAPHLEEPWILLLGFWPPSFVCPPAAAAADCGDGHIRLGGETMPSNPGLFPPFPIVGLRKFPVAGTYEYRTNHGTGGRIVVVDESLE